MDDGTVHPADEPGPLDHPSGRCVRLPIARSWQRLGYTEDEPQSVIQPAQDRFAALSEADQIRIMGRARHALWASGAVDWQRLATRRESSRWRPSYVPTPIRDLQRFAATRQPV